jgi:hypothetical protein
MDMLEGRTELMILGALLTHDDTDGTLHVDVRVGDSESGAPASGG